MLLFPISICVKQAGAGSKSRLWAVISEGAYAKKWVLFFFFYGDKISLRCELMFKPYLGKQFNGVSHSPH